MFDMEILYASEGHPAPTPKTPAAVIPAQSAPTKTTVPHPKPAAAPEVAKLATTPPKETPAPAPVVEKRTPSPILLESTAKVVDKAPEVPTSNPLPIKPTPPLAREPHTPVPAPAKIQAPPPPTPLDTNIVEQLARITSLLETQNKTLASQDKHIAELTKELDTLKNKVDARGGEDSSRKDEIIRKLELELEEAKS